MVKAPVNQNAKESKTKPKKEYSLGNGVVSTSGKYQFWLVKLPSTLASKWTAKPPSSTLGELEIKIEDGKGVPFVKDADGESYKMAVGAMQKLHVIQKDADQVAFAGKVESIFQMTPMNLQSSYMRARTITIDSNKAVRKTQPISFDSPESKQRLAAMVKNQQSKTAEEKRLEKLIKERGKAVKSDRAVVLQKILEMFEEQKYISFNELRDETNQPEDYLRDILREVAVYINSGEHRKKWTLKENYQTFEGGTEEEWE